MDFKRMVLDGIDAAESGLVRLLEGLSSSGFPGASTETNDEVKTAASTILAAHPNNVETAALATLKDLAANGAPGVSDKVNTIVKQAAGAAVAAATGGSIMNDVLPLLSTTANIALEIEAAVPPPAAVMPAPEPAPAVEVSPVPAPEPVVEPVAYPVAPPAITTATDLRPITQEDGA